MLDYASLLFGPAYDLYGVPAVLTLADTAETEVTLTVIDKTAGLNVGTNVETGTIEPAAVLRMSELTEAGLTRESLDDASIAFNGGSWAIINNRPKPTPKGEADGEIILMLEAK